jgi:hypothetical protein
MFIVDELVREIGITTVEELAAELPTVEDVAVAADCLVDVAELVEMMPDEPSGDHDTAGDGTRRE